MAGRVQQRRFWTTHVRRFDESGLTRREYCARHDLAPSTLDYWRRRLRLEPAPAFVPVQPRPAAAPVAAVSPGSTLQLNVGGADLILPADVDATWLASLLRALR